MSKIAVIGGTGPQGRGLAYRMALAGHTVVIGSRDASRATEKATEIQAKLTCEQHVSGSDNMSAAEDSEIIILAVPWDGHAQLIESLAPALAGKIIISCVNPLAFDDQGPYGLTLEESAAEETQRLVPDAAVVGSFHHVAALSLWKTAAPLEQEDILVCGNDEDAKNVVINLAVAITGKPGINAGALRLARQLEPLTAVLININKQYKIRSGLAIAGVEGKL